MHFKKLNAKLILLLFLVTSITVYSLQQEPILQAYSNFTANLTTRLNLLLPMLQRTTNNCPQLDLPLGTFGNSPVMLANNYKEWIVINDLILLKHSPVYCFKGSKEGQNRNYWYCGYEDAKLGTLYMANVQIAEDGTIGKTTKIAFYNIYDKDREFIETICLGDPERLSEAAWQNFKHDIKHMFD